MPALTVFRRLPWLHQWILSVLYGVLPVYGESSCLLEHSSHLMSGSASSLSTVTGAQSQVQVLKVTHMNSKRKSEDIRCHFLSINEFKYQR